VLYEQAHRRVVAVIRDGLRAPYFELDDADVVSHRLVATPEAERPPTPTDRRAAR